MFARQVGLFFVCCAVALAGCRSSFVAHGDASDSFIDQTPAKIDHAPVPARTSLPSYPAHRRAAGSFAPIAEHAYLYIADQSNNQIDIFPLEGKRQPQVGTITAGIDAPYGLWEDVHRSLYVANQSNNTVTKYEYGSTTPALTYSQGLSRPLYPIVDRQGNLFVSNANNGTVVEYRAGSTAVCQVLRTPGAEADGMAFDKHGNLYVAYRTSPIGLGSIEEFERGSSEGEVIGMTLNQPQGVIIDRHENVVAVETGGTNRIDVFPPGSRTASLEVLMPQLNTPTQLAIDRVEENLYVSALYSGIVYGNDYPLRTRSFFVKDQVQAIIQGVTISTNQTF